MYRTRTGEYVSEDINSGLSKAAATAYGCMTVLVTVLFCVSVTAEVFVRQRIGPLYVVVAGGLSFVMMWLFSMVYPRYNEAFGVFMIFFVGACLYHIIVRIFSVDAIHSASSGKAYLAWIHLFGEHRYTSTIVYLGAEPALVLAVGYAVQWWASPMLGLWLVMAGWALFVKALVINIVWAFRQQHAVDNHDFAESMHGATRENVNAGQRARWTKATVVDSNPPPGPPPR